MAVDYREMPSPLYWLDGAEKLRLARGPSAPIRPAVFRLLALINGGKVRWAFECEIIESGELIYPQGPNDYWCNVNPEALALVAEAWKRGEKVRFSHSIQRILPPTAAMPGVVPIARPIFETPLPEGCDTCFLYVDQGDIDKAIGTKPPPRTLREEKKLARDRINEVSKPGMTYGEIYDQAIKPVLWDHPKHFRPNSTFVKDAVRATPAWQNKPKNKKGSIKGGRPKNDS